MKVLVVDDDPVARTFLRRYFSQKFSYQVIEAVNGLEGLSRLDDESPDIIMLDIGMPMIDGIEFLEIVRRDPLYRFVPVIVLTATKERDKMERLVELGIQDLLLKPLETKEAHNRISRLIDKIERSAGDSPGNGAKTEKGLLLPKLLIVDGNKQFRTFFQSLFSELFEVAQARSGMEAYGLCLKELPDFVCLGDDLRLVTQEYLAAKLRRIDPKGHMMIVSCSESEPTPLLSSGLIEGWVKKSTIPETFIADLERCMLGQKYSLSKLMRIMRFYVIPAFIPTLNGVFDIEELHVLVEHDKEMELHGLNIHGCVDVIDQSRVCGIRVGLLGSEIDVLKAVGRVIDASASIRHTRVDAVRELVRNIASRVSAILESHGVVTTLADASVTVLNGSSAPINWSFALSFKTKLNERYVVGMTVDPAFAGSLE